jgi:formiminoglutamase
MSGESSSAAEWFSLLEPAPIPTDIIRRADDPRLVEALDFWDGDPADLQPGRAVLLGFPQDEGVRRNHGRTGAAQAPQEIRSRLYRLTPWDYQAKVDLREHRLLDLGNVRIAGNLEETQHRLALVIGAILRTGAVPLVLGGGHETAFGHYLGYVAAQKRVGIINLDAHLDLRPWSDGQGHSGSPFRQAIEHATCPLPGRCYVCLGVQPASVSREHWQYARRQGCVVRWADQVRRSLRRRFGREYKRLAAAGCHIYVSLDADVVRASDVPGVSAPNPAGLPGRKVLAWARRAGSLAEVSSFELVEINPRYDRDGLSVRWAALILWNFLVGWARRAASPK